MLRVALVSMKKLQSYVCGRNLSGLLKDQGKNENTTRSDLIRVLWGLMGHAASAY